MNKAQQRKFQKRKKREKAIKKSKSYRPIIPSLYDDDEMIQLNFAEMDRKGMGLRELFKDDPPPWLTRTDYDIPPELHPDEVEKFKRHIFEQRKYFGYLPEDAKFEDHKE